MSNEASERRIAPEALVQAAQGFETFCPGGALDPSAAAFLEQIAQDASGSDVAALGPEALAGLAAGFWRWTAQKRADAQEIRLLEARDRDGRPLGRDLLEICGPDMPFLVDSVMGEIGAQGVDVLAMFHPVVQIARDADGRRGAEGGGAPYRESLIQVHLQPVPPSRRDAVLMGVRETLADVRLSVGDFPAMKARMKACVGALASASTRASADEIGESVAFLKWLADDHFVFFGARSYDYPRGPDGAWTAEEPEIREDLNLGILRDPLRMVLRRLNEPSVLTPAVRAYVEEPQPVIVAKSNLRSRVHRRAVMDYVGVKRFGDSGEVLGEDRFVGLFTAEAYDRMARDVPLLRGKVERVIARAGWEPGSHNDKRFRNIVENYPRDELFQIDEGDLLRIALGVQHLMDRPRTRLFVRRDRFDRFVSILVFVPRDRYNSGVRERIGQVLAEAWDGRLSAFYPQFGDAPLARVHFIIGVTPGAHAEPDLAEIEARITDLTRTWDDGLEALAEARGQSALVAPWLGGFPAGYRDACNAADALADIVEMEALEPDGVRARAWRRPDDPPHAFRVTICKAGAPAPLSALVPVFEGMGLFVDSETPHAVTRQRPDGGRDTLHVQDLSMRAADHSPIDMAAMDAVFADAFSAIWTGLAESDGFNRLILLLGASWREAALIRALARWRGQTGLDPSELVQQQALAAHPEVTRRILDLFKARFDPARTGRKARDAEARRLNGELSDLLDAVSSLDHDRALRRLAQMVNAVQRTNWWQTDAAGAPKAWMSFKIAPRELADVPAPKPHREIWVYAPQVEGAHLRFGPVARGGLRWSDRRDDFRTEVLGLVKAQQVKNAVIVPVGSKGAFYPKRLPAGGAREAVQAEGIAAYKTFLRGLLDLTDNIAEDGRIVPPPHVVRHDGDDPYLVVAADKGTAAFSDIANAVSAEYGHWLGDAFASGGSVGYDHKKMGITARGAWEAVKRHFREMGRDTQSEPFTVIGVGDMSGDVFGNGMLLSGRIRLLAAFDHRHIFIDPDPDPAASFAERGRLFALPRSSWADYDAKLISPGGGVFPRDAKAVPLNDAIRALTGLEGDSAAPSDLMRALLAAPCDLMWFGGIGTYVKAATESHADAGDKANDAIRVDGRDLRCKVVGEGANLGLTQRGRIEAARAGVRLNTDAIDNSAGVDSSDHEVNIKILLNGLVAQGAMDMAARDALLASMTDDVAAHVLAHNYAQTLALSLQAASAPADLDAHERFVERLEAAGRLDRNVEFLPGPDGFRALREAGRGLTRPELAVLTAYGKLHLFDELIASDAPDDPWFGDTLKAYFPAGCRQWPDAMQAHRLKREIIATVLANAMVDLGGATFLDRVRESAAAETGAIARAFAAARAIFGLDEAVAAVNALDLKAPAAVQVDLMGEIVQVLRRQCFWLARRGAAGGLSAGNLSVGELVAAYGEGVAALKPIVFDMVSPFERQRLEQRASALAAAGAPAALARSIAALRPLISATDIVDIAAATGLAPADAARLHHRAGMLVGFDELRWAAGQAAGGGGHWDRVAARRLIEDLMHAQDALSVAVGRAALEADLRPSGAAAGDAVWARQAVDAWAATRRGALAQARRALDELESSPGGWTFAKLTIAAAQVREGLAMPADTAPAA